MQRFVGMTLIAMACMVALTKAEESEGQPEAAGEEEPIAEGQIPDEIAALIRADIKKRNLPLVDEPTAEAELFVREGKSTRSPAGEELVVISALPELNGRGVALVALGEGRYWTLARPEGSEQSVANGPFRFTPAGPPPELAAWIDELNDASGPRQREILNAIFTSRESWGHVEAALAGREEAAAEEIRRTIGRLVRQEIRAELASDADGGFYDEQFKHLERYGAPGQSALFRLMRDGDEHPDVRAYAAQALGEIGDAATAKELDEAMSSMRMSSRMFEAIAYSLARLGERRHVDRIIETLESAIAKAPDAGRNYFQLAQVFVRVGDRQRALDLYQEYLKRAPTGPEAGLTHYNIACVHSIMGEVDLAFTELQKAIDMGGVDFDWMVKDGDLNNLHKDPRWEELVQKRKPRQGTRRIF